MAKIPMVENEFGKKNHYHVQKIYLKHSHEQKKRNWHTSHWQKKTLANI